MLRGSLSLSFSSRRAYNILYEPAKSTLVPRMASGKRPHTQMQAKEEEGGGVYQNSPPPHTTALIDAESCFYCEGRGVRKYYPSPPRQNAHGLDRPMQAKGGLFKRYFDFSPGQKIEFGFETSPTTYPVPRSKLKIVL